MRHPTKKLIPIAAVAVQQTTSTASKPATESQISGGWSLPSELTQSVFDLLGTGDLVRIGRTCKLFRNNATEILKRRPDGKRWLSQLVTLQQRSAANKVFIQSKASVLSRNQDLSAIIFFIAKHKTLNEKDFEFAQYMCSLPPSICQGVRLNTERLRRKRKQEILEKGTSQLDSNVVDKSPLFFQYLADNPFLLNIDFVSIPIIAKNLSKALVGNLPEMRAAISDYSAYLSISKSNWSGPQFFENCGLDLFSELVIYFCLFAEYSQTLSDHDRVHYSSFMSRLPEGRNGVKELYNCVSRFFEDEPVIARYKEIFYRCYMRFDPDAFKNDSKLYSIYASVVQHDQSEPEAQEQEALELAPIAPTDTSSLHSGKNPFKTTFPWYYLTALSSIAASCVAVGSLVLAIQPAILPLSVLPPVGLLIATMVVTTIVALALLAATIYLYQQSQTTTKSNSAGNKAYTSCLDKSAEPTVLASPPVLS